VGDYSDSNLVVEVVYTLVEEGEKDMLVHWEVEGSLGYTAGDCGIEVVVHCCKERIVVDWDMRCKGVQPRI